MVRKRISALEADLDARKFDPSHTRHLFDRTFRGLALLEGLIQSERTDDDSRHEYDLIVDGLSVSIAALKTCASEIDEKMKLPER